MSSQLQMRPIPFGGRPQIAIFISRLLPAVLIVLSMNSAKAQTALIQKPTRQARPMRSAASVRTNQQIARLVQEIDARNIERTIHKLVSFGTRNTLSTQDDPNRGIGAARDWLFSEFSKAAETSGGRMT